MQLASIPCKRLEKTMKKQVSGCRQQLIKLQEVQICREHLLLRTVGLLAQIIYLMERRKEMPRGLQ